MESNSVITTNNDYSFQYESTNEKKINGKEIKKMSAVDYIMKNHCIKCKKKLSLKKVKSKMQYHYCSSCDENYRLLCYFLTLFFSLLFSVLLIFFFTNIFKNSFDSLVFFTTILILSFILYFPIFVIFVISIYKLLFIYRIKSFRLWALNKSKGT